MRMRRKKNGAARLEAHAHLLCPLPTEPLTDYAEIFGRSAPLYLEIGCGKGAFACGMAAANPDASFLAMERVHDVVVAAVEKADACAETRPDNLRFMIADAKNLENCFLPESIARLYLNFSDPWPKKGYYKRRLTYRGFLRVYFRLLCEGGAIFFKTDNRGLFDFTLEELSALGCDLDYVTYDLHSSPLAVGNVMTEYEKNFSEKGVPICALKVTKPKNFVFEEKNEEGDAQ